MTYRETTDETAFQYSRLSVNNIEHVYLVYRISSIKRPPSFKRPSNFEMLEISAPF